MIVESGLDVPLFLPAHLGETKVNARHSWINSQRVESLQPCIDDLRRQDTFHIVNDTVVRQQGTEVKLQKFFVSDS